MWWTIFLAADVVAGFLFMAWFKARRDEKAVLKIMRDDGGEWTASRLVQEVEFRERRIISLPNMGIILETLELRDLLTSRPQYHYDDTPLQRLYRVKPPQLEAVP